MATAKPWVDFEEVKAKATFEQVLDHYGIKYDFNSQQEAKITCPFHKNGQEQRPSCTINREKKAFKCWSCPAKGNILDFVKAREGGTIRDAGIKLAEICGSEPSQKPKTGSEGAETPQDEVYDDQRPETIPEGYKYIGDGKLKATSNKQGSDTRSETAENKPLSFALTLDHHHPFLKNRGVDPKTAEEFGFGYCKRGSMQGRICFPIHNETGGLVAYSGRWAEEEVPDDVVRYLLPKNFNKTRELFLFHRHFAEPLVEPGALILVEGFWTAIDLSQRGYSACGLMGHSLGEGALDMLRRYSPYISRVIVAMDPDEAGEAATPDVIMALSEFVPTLRFTWSPEEPGGLNDHDVERLAALYFGNSEEQCP